MSYTVIYIYVCLLGMAYITIYTMPCQLLLSCSWMTHIISNYRCMHWLLYATSYFTYLTYKRLHASCLSSECLWFCSFCLMISILMYTKMVSSAVFCVSFVSVLMPKHFFIVLLMDCMSDSAWLWLCSFYDEDMYSFLQNCLSFSKMKL